MNTTGRMELLAPAGDEAALRAAVCAGANAVYLGYARFGARASAANFDADALEKAVAYAHLHQVRVYVTVNTLIKPDELPDVSEALGVIDACRADAVIVQDFGVARIAREKYPSLALHASTQMALHTEAGARFARERGFARVVLARECTLETVARVAKAGVAAEVFAHGALCAAVSGQCLMSSLAGGRSGNRGRCAQPCRQTVTLGDTTAALLSMRDLCLRDHLPELQAAGVSALKIEGRLKRPEYVAVVVDSYRRALDALAAGAFRPMDAKERERLMQVFHRGGFTGGHILGAEDADLCATRRVGHGGVRIGTVTAARDGLLTARLTAPLHDGDSLRLEGRTDVEMRYAGHEEQSVATLRLRPGETARPGDPVVRLLDAWQLQWTQSLTEKPIPITLRATVRAGAPLRLTASDGVSEGQAVGQPAQSPLKRPLTQDDIARSLARLGDTPFVLDGNPDVETDGAFAPVSALNALRRDALTALAEARRDAFWRAGRAATPSGNPADDQPTVVAPPVGVARTEATRQADGERTDVALPADGARTAAAESVGGARAWVARPVEGMRPIDPERADGPRAAAPEPAARALPRALGPETLAVSFDRPELAQAFREAGANLLIYRPADLRQDALAAALDRLPSGVWLALPPQLSDDAFARAWHATEAHRAKLGGVVLGSVGQLGLRTGLPVALGDGVPVTNREAARELLHAGIAFYTLWPEWSGEELAKLSWKDTPSLLRVYGRERVMLLNHCPERVARGLAAGRAECSLCGPEDRACARPDPALSDRRGYRFPLGRVRTPEGCVVEVYNALPTDLARQEKRRRVLGAGMLLGFTVEPPDRQPAITRRFAAVLRGEDTLPLEEPVTGGHFRRGVE